ncbi:MAG: Hpt domain-containing protein [Vicinamibacterales bacterium]|nr:Hpt domain-containing protein [Vicinamibacterales bacterium]
MDEPAPAAMAIDRRALDQLRGLTGEAGSDLVNELVDLFESTSAETITDLRASVARGEAAAAARLAHSLAGSALTLGASGIASLARRMQDLASTARLDLLPALIDETEALLKPTLAGLRESQP